MSKIGENLHLNKCAILRGLTDTFEVYGNGYDMEIKVSFLVINVRVIHFDKGVLYGASNFWVEMQEGDQGTVYACAVDRLQKHLKKIGAEFEPVYPWHHKGIEHTQNLFMEKKNASVANKQKN